MTTYCSLFTNLVHFVYHLSHSEDLHKVQQRLPYDRASGKRDHRLWTQRGPVDADQVQSVDPWGVVHGEAGQSAGRNDKRYVGRTTVLGAILSVSAFTL